MRPARLKNPATAPIHPDNTRESDSYHTTRMKQRKKQKLIDIALAAAGIGLVALIFVLAIKFAPDDPFSDTEFVQDVGRRHAYP